MTPDFVHQELDALKRNSLYRQLRLAEGEQGPTLRLDGQEVLNFSSNNYLGLANHPSLREAAKQAIDRYGCGSGASRLISGNMTLHEELEAKIAALKGTEAALVFNSGFQANVGLLATLVGEHDIIFSDALNHASVIDGCRLSRAKITVYAHCDTTDLKNKLEAAPPHRRKLIVTESVFSMDGDEAPLARITELAETYGAILMVDEAHATGVYEPSGAGLVSKLGLQDRVAVQMGTLGKALGGFGAYVAASKPLRELILNRCRSFIYTTSLPPAVCAMAVAAIDLIKHEPERRQALRQNCERLRQGLSAQGFLVGGRSHILPLIVGDSSKCMELSSRLLQLAVFVQAIRPPTVPPGTARLRATLMATHTAEHLERALTAFEELKSQL